MLLNKNVHKKMKDMRLGVKAWIFQLPYGEHHAYITSQQVRTCLSILLHHLPQHIQHTHIKDSAATILYAAIWCLALLMKKTLHQIAAYFMDKQSNLYLYSNTWFTTTHLYQAQMTPSRMLLLKKKKTSQQLC